MTKRTTASIFSALALGTALASGMPGTAQAMEPVTACKPEGIFQTFNTTRGQQAFGNDGCVYTIINGNPLAIKNYNLEDGREAERFSREIQTAETAQNREIARQERLEQQQQARCDRYKSDAIRRGLDSLIRGRDIRIADASRAITECTLRR